MRRIVRFPDHALYPEDMAKGKSDWAIREKKADILFRLKTRLRNGQVCNMLVRLTKDCPLGFIKVRSYREAV